ncbi:MAG: FHA domain-containing protein [Actinobacteria bacterium]|nr:MAG: FHA domain-containing protein [Actinomycetota bacterium]
MSHIYCQECGFQNPEAANYCARCGALLVKDEGGTEATQTFTADDAEDTPAEALENVGVQGPALVVRSGGGRSGEMFPLDGETTVGRSPDCGIFLDDVTVSRKHAILREREGTFSIEDQGSLNGTFVNRKRVESAQLEDGDELQVGKYRLTYFGR